MSCKPNCSCIVCHVKNMRQQKLVNGVSWPEILKFEADSPVLSHLLRPCDSFMVELNDKFLPSICRIQDAWRAYREIRKGVCMDCGAPFKDLRRCPSVNTQDGVARCESCEECYSICSICLDPVDRKNDSCTTECGHEFHFSCMVKALSKKSSCPMCRNPLGGPLSDLPEPPPMHQQREARIRHEGHQRGYEEGLAEPIPVRLAELYRRRAEYRQIHGFLNDEVGPLEELTQAEIEEAEYELDVQLPPELTAQEMAELEMADLMRDMSNPDFDLPRFVRETVWNSSVLRQELEIAQREREDARIREQAAYDSGLVDGRSIANEDLRLLRQQLSAAQAEIHHLKNPKKSNL